MSIRERESEKGVRESEKVSPFPVSDYTETRFERESGKREREKKTFEDLEIFSKKKQAANLKLRTRKQQRRSKK